ncbi:PQQ-dependent sugar dehydrogenase [Microvirga splendida]|uniref:PQQ-dependent sugar dehydrogenase n=1 Tax=Microvirga splendida TaxID=2795727 RepID=A0ABS0XXE4_9HYPH|nr:PQQ-dependent sugar dehydrogenase [Microvirga splendida]MBJ6124721.1 PQQ-dependent sugar dehydrogenase [Microvirga splendida]
MATIYGTSGADTRTGTSDADTIYGYDPNASEIVGTRIASGLTQPLFVTGAPDNSGRLFIVGKQGTIHIAGTDTPFLDVTDQVATAGEVGLLGFTFHPDFANNGKVYVFLSVKGETTDDPRHNQSQIREYTVDPAHPNELDPNNYKLILETTEYTPFSGNHRAGWIGFHPTDGYLYAAIGDGDQNAKAQDPTSLLGKILRLDVNGPDAFPADDKKNYAIPADNPTVFDNAPDLAQPSEVYAIGFRNPWRASFDQNGRLFVGDVGADTAEEINLVVPGANYGWGRQDNGGAPDDGPTPGTNDGYTDAIHSYFHSEGIGSSVTGGYVYNGPIAALQGKYVFGDFGSGRIWTLEQIGTDWVRTDITAMIVPSAGTIERIASFGTDNNGNLYVVDITGEVFRLDAGGGGSDLGDILNGAEGNDTIYGGGGNDTIHGGDNDDHIFGEADDDRLYGDAGADTLEGGSGNDVYYVDIDDIIVEETDSGIDHVRVLASATSFVLHAGQAVEALQADNLASTSALDLTGNEFSQTLTGNAGSNRLDGRGGADTMIGLGGNDTYVVDDEGDLIVEGMDGGIDTVESMIDFSFEPGGVEDPRFHLENLILLGTAAKGTGNYWDNYIKGNDTANTLDGAGGADTLEGGDGSDTYRVNSAEDVIVEASGKGTDTIIVDGSYTLAGGVHVEILKADEESEISDLTGNELGNTLHGNRGANRLDGGGGSDTVVFTGRRVDYTVTRNHDGSFLLEDSRTDGDGVDTVLKVEIFRFSDGPITAENLLNKAPTGITSEFEVVAENSKNGTPIVTFKVTDADDAQHRFELVDDAEGRFAIDPSTGALTVKDGTRLDYEQATRHSITVKAIDGAGASITRTLFITVDDVLNESATGSALGDLMLGGSGQDTFSGGAGNDTIDAAAGNDRLNGDAGNDSLVGGAGNDVFSGGDGNDRMIGGKGKDTFTGGKGRDVFVFDDRETASSKSKADYITDFRGRDRDRIDLKLVDANTKKRGDQKFSFIGDDESFSKAGEVRFEKTKKYTYVYLNTDNDRAAEGVIKLKGSIELSKSWFVL